MTAEVARAAHDTEPAYRFDLPLSPGVFIRRAGRFTMETRLSDGTPGLLHLPNGGRLQTVLLPGARVLYRPRNRGPRKGEGPARVTDGRATLVEVAGDVGWVTVDATLPARALSHILRAAAGAGLKVVAYHLEASPDRIRLARRPPVELS